MALTSWICLVLGLVSIAQCAPVDLPIGDKPHRESTKEILNLEQQLKAQAGEGKTYFPSQQSIPFPPPGEEPADPLLDGQHMQEEIGALIKAEIKNKEAEKSEEIAVSAEDTEEISHGDDSAENEDGDAEEKELLDAEKKAAIKPEASPEEEVKSGGEQETEAKEEVDEDDEENEFLKNVIKSLHKHPELMEELRDYPDVPPIPLSDEADQEEDIRNEYLLAEKAREQQGQYAPYGDQYEEEDDYYDDKGSDNLYDDRDDEPYDDRSDELYDDRGDDEQQEYEEEEEEEEMPRLPSNEPVQQYYGDRLGKVVAKKWSLDSPEEVYKQYYREAESDEEYDDSLEHDDMSTESDDEETESDDVADKEDVIEEVEGDKTGEVEEDETEKVSVKEEDINETSGKSVAASKGESSDVLVAPVAEEAALDKAGAKSEKAGESKAAMM